MSDGDSVRMNVLSVLNVLDTYGDEIPWNIGESARRRFARNYQSDYPRTLAVLRPSDDHALAENEWVGVTDVDGGDGVLVSVTLTPEHADMLVGLEDGCNEINEIYVAIDRGVLQGCLRSLVTKTSLVLAECEDECRPTLDDDTVTPHHTARDDDEESFPVDSHDSTATHRLHHHPDAVSHTAVHDADSEYTEAIEDFTT